MKLQNFVALSFSIFSVILVLFLSACGGEEEQGGQSENKQDSNVGGDGMPPPTPAENTPPPVKQDEIATPEKPKAVPSPNGVYLPTGEEKNGKAVYENQEGFSMWNDGVSWKITDRTGGGKVISPSFTTVIPLITSSSILISTIPSLLGVSSSRI